VLSPFFGEDSFRFNFVGYGLMTKSLRAGCIFEGVGGQAKCQKMNVNPSTIKLE
jgi:hypothetical protein